MRLTILLQAAGVEQDLVNPPVEEIFAEGEDADVVCNVELAGTVEVEDGVEGSWMSGVGGQ